MLWENLEERPGLARDWKDMPGQKQGHGLQGLGSSCWHCRCGAAWVEIQYSRNLSLLVKSWIPESRAWIKAAVKDSGLGLRQPSVIGTSKDRLGNQILWILGTQWKWDKCKYKLMSHYLWGSHIPPPRTEPKGQCGSMVRMSDLLPLPQCFIREDTQPFSACFSFCKRGIVLPIS